VFNLYKKDPVSDLTKQWAFIRKINQSMLRKELKAVYCKNRTKYIKVFCEKNAYVFSVKPGGTQSKCKAISALISAI
jgi:hypothetical protein